MYTLADVPCHRLPSYNLVMLLDAFYKGFVCWNLFICPILSGATLP